MTFNESDFPLSLPTSPFYQPGDDEPKRFAVTRGAGEKREDERSYYKFQFELEKIFKSTAAPTCQFAQCRLVENKVT